MNEIIERWMDKNLLNELLEGTINAPSDLLGMHIFEGMQIFTVFRPCAQRIFVKTPHGKKEHELECLHPRGLFGIAIKKGQYRSYQFKVQYAEDDIITFYDPYIYPTTITDYDCHLFAEGSHYEIYEKLGAHPETVGGVQGTRFAVYAPNARAVNVVGTFNMWDGSMHPMILHGVKGIYELFIPGVAENEIYKFQITTRWGEKLFKTDPYGNYAEVRPGNASKIYDINQYKWDDKAYYNKRKSKSSLARERMPMNIYEVHIGSWRRVDDGRPDGFYTYREAADELGEYLLEMGYTHVELMGISEYPFDGSWGYQVGCYYAPTSRYGTPSDFMYFVNKMHNLGIEVILDWVPAHFPKDEQALGRFDGQAVYEYPDPRRGEHPDWGTYIFNYGKKEVKNFLIANALFWVEKYHIDGLRVDAVASMLYLDYGKSHGQWIANKDGGNEHYEAVEFMRHLNQIMKERHPEAYIIAEESTAWVGVTEDVKKDGLGFTYKWNMGWMNDFTEYMKLDPFIKSHRYGQLKFSISYYLAEKYILVLSHDEVVHGKCSMINKMFGLPGEKFANLKATYGFMFGHPGKKLLFMGQEFAQLREWSEERELDWELLNEEAHLQIQRFVKDLNQLYLSYEAFYYNDYHEIGFEWMDCESPEQNTIAFVRRGKSKNNQLLIAINFSPIGQDEYCIKVPCLGKYTEIINSDDTIYGGEGRVNKKPISAKKTKGEEVPYKLTMKLPPLSVVIMKYDYILTPRE